MKKNSNIGSTVLLLQFIFSDQLFAYIDPGSVAAFLQLIVAAVIGVFIFARNYITHFVRKLLRIIKKDSKNK